MFFHRIQHRLIFVFVILVITILLIGGWMLHWMIRQSLETELGRKLMAVARAASVQFEDEEIGFLIQGAGPRTAVYLRQQLLRLKASTDVKRITFFDLSGNSLLDTEESIVWGTPYFNLRFYRREMAEIKEGKSAYSVLFEGIDGLPTMTGYAPLYREKQIVGGIGVDGSVTFLDAVNRMRDRLYLIGIIGSCAAIGLGILMAGSITRPIEKLVKASRQIGKGNYTDPIQSLGRGEIGLLAGTMEEMRRGVIERERDLKAMLAGVAHEIRNPLGGIELFAGLLTDEVAQDVEAARHVDRIVKEVAQLKEIVDSFLIYARPQEPHREDCLLNDTVEEAAHLVEHQMRKNGIVFSIPEKNDSVHVWADPNHLKRIILNLMQNAIQALPDGGEIKIHWRTIDNTVSLFFEDSGEGIPGEIQEEIFTPFFTSRERGTGLGLSIVKGLAEANGGSIRLVQSDKNGTIFEVKLEKCGQT